MLFFLYRKCQYSNAKETNELFSVERTNLIANRRSRHLYDLERMMDKPFALKAVHNDDLWEHIRQHRMAFTAMLGVDYTDNMRAHLCLTPPEQWRNEWKEDYERMILPDILFFSSQTSQIFVTKILDKRSLFPRFLECFTFGKSA